MQSMFHEKKTLQFREHKSFTQFLYEIENVFATEHQSITSTQ